jgi:hypothetical protein
MEIIFPLLMVVFFATTVFFAFRSAAKIRKEFPRWAEELGWTPKPMTSWTASPEAEGVHNGRRGRIYSYTTGSGKSRTTWAAVELRGEGAPRLELAFTRQGFGTKIASMFGAKEVEVGDAAFDARWFIRTNRPEFVKAALLPEVRARIDELATRGGSGMRLEFTGGKAVYAEQGGFNAAVRARIAAALPVLTDLAALAEVEAAS